MKPRARRGCNFSQRLHNQNSNMKARSWLYLTITILIQSELIYPALQANYLSFRCTLTDKIKKNIQDHRTETIHYQEVSGCRQDNERTCQRDSKNYDKERRPPGNVRGCTAKKISRRLRKIMKRILKIPHNKKKKKKQTIGRGEEEGGGGTESIK